MKPMIRVLILAATVLALSGLQGCTKKDGLDFCNISTSTLQPPSTLKEVVEMSNAMVVGPMNDVDRTDSEKLGFSLTGNCKVCYFLSGMNAPEHGAVATFDEDALIQQGIPELIAPCAWCREITYTQTVCDGGEDRDGSDCHEQSFTENTCKLPEWHYNLESKPEEEWAAFVLRSVSNPNKPTGLIMRFKVTEGRVDMTDLPGGEMVEVEELKTLLRSYINVEKGTFEYPEQL